MKAYRLAPGTLVPVAVDVGAPGRGQIAVRVRASSVNFRDLMIFEGKYPFAIAPSMIPLSDGAGEVIAVGDDVTRFQVGDRVTNSFFPTWFGGPFVELGPMYGGDADGWLTRAKIVDAEAMVGIPSHLTFEEASTLPCAGVTAFVATRGVGPADTVLVQGTGGVSLFALQLAVAAGARVIATTSSADKATKLRELGADAVIDRSVTPDWPAAVIELTSGRGVDRVVEVAGSFAASIRAVAYRGEIAFVGLLDPDRATIEAMSLFAKQARIRPVGGGSRADLEALVRIVDGRSIHPVIGRTIGFDAAPQLFAGYRADPPVGKLVVRHD